MYSLKYKVTTSTCDSAAAKSVPVEMTAMYSEPGSLANSFWKAENSLSMSPAPSRR